MRSRSACDAAASPCTTNTVVGGRLAVRIHPISSLASACTEKPVRSQISAFTRTYWPWIFTLLVPSSS